MEQQMQEMTKFDDKTAKKVFTRLKPMFPLANKPISEERASSSENFMILDPSCVMAIESKTMEARIALAPFKEDEEEMRSMPKLDYDSMAKYGTGSRFSSQYLKEIFALFDACEDSVQLQVGKDYPGTFEGKHFKITLAPRVGED